MRTIFKVLTTIITAALIAAPAAAQTQPTAPTSTPTQVNSQPQSASQTQAPAQSSQVSIKTTEYSGQVLKVAGNKLTIDTSSGTKQFSVPGNVQIQRNTNLVQLSQLKPGDKITVKATSSGEVLSISATAGSVTRTGKYIVALLIIALIVALIIWYLLRKRNRGFIKTVPTKV